jgi:hypothetical protein
LHFVNRIASIHRALAALAALATLAVGCAPDRPVAPMVVFHTDPAPDGVLAANAPARLRLSHHLAADVVLAGRARLYTGPPEDEREVAVVTGYDPVDRAVVVIPRLDLLVGQTYHLQLVADGLVSAEGRPLEADLSLDFVAGSPVAPAQGPGGFMGGERGRPLALFADVEPLFAGRCGCHGDGSASPPLTPAGLLGRASARSADRPLVVPGEPRASLLVHKILADHPLRPGAPMPLGGPPLSATEQRLVVAWVEDLGAPVTVRR